MSQQLNKEKLTFKIGLSGTYWNKKPQYTILINLEEMASGFISKPSDIIQYVTFSHELDQDKEYTLVIRLENKTDEDIVKNPSIGEPFVIEKDLLLNIHSIEINEFDLGKIVQSSGKFIADEASQSIIDSCVNLGNNGCYVLDFRTPFFVWLYENM